MKIQKLLFGLGITLTILPCPIKTGLPPANAQTLINPGSVEDEPRRSRKIMVAKFLVRDFGEGGGWEMASDAKIEVSSLVTSGNWMLAGYMVVSSVRPHGRAGQLLFKKEANGWVHKGSGNILKDVQILMDHGVPRSNAESLAAS